MKEISASKAFDGTQFVLSHASEACACDMTFALFLPPQAATAKVPLVWYLSGLTCTHQNVMDKGEYRRKAAELGLAVICPDTSPRGEDVPDEPGNWQFSKGAGFYVDATQEPWARNYRMQSYIMEELPALVGASQPLDMSRQSIMGHSMGGHGALTLALKNPHHFKAVSALAPISQASTADWSRVALEKYLGPDQSTWRSYDATLLIEDGHKVDEILVDQGAADPFMNGLCPWLLDEACAKAGINLTLNMRDGYDHSYNFVSTFMADHLAWHAERLG